MITFLRGTIVDKQPTSVVLDVAGVGYEVFIPLSSYERLPSTGQECRILTIDHVREDAHILFGFMSENERHLFVLLTSISGVGPKLALGALSGMTVRDLKLAVVEGDVKRISTISGIGKKTAERIVVELKHKLTDQDALEAVAGANERGSEGDGLLKDAIMALTALGYKQEDARKMVMKADEAMSGAPTDVEALIKRALSR